MAAGDVLIGRRIQLAVDENFRYKIPEWWYDDIRPGDYCGPVVGYTGSKPSVTFILPNARDPDALPGARGFHHVVSPPHVFRECPDGSLEIRESISDMPSNSGWHGYLDEGHRWRQV